MGWFVRERRGIGWKNETLNSISAPPLPLVVFFGVFIMLMYFAGYSEFKEKVERSKMGLRFGLVLLPVVGVVAVHVMLLHRTWLRPAAAAADEEGWPWGLLLVVALLLVMVYYHSSFHSAWFRSF